MKEAIEFVMVMLVLTFAISMSAIYKLKKQVEQLEARKPVIIYQVDNAGTEMFGKVTAKDVIDSHYYVEVKPYGKFLVTREQYDSINIGDEMPEFLKGRRS
ncbi:DUF1372 family protein [Streptococcus suis]|uniref:DUF1372 family protein n=1 Tax=Streptococcus suis TaxID=1307 RepID=UPI001CF5198B|nr:DUF1372 family protein [Streptococcus suis]MBS8054230.1 DUF1372 family protein [Streptococcus suis]MCB2852933.1 DUF1372 family protein [Streptococcus suis]MCB2857520.1 DUF1372 family protein [Streptococcus suis]MCB2865154.1 DUF1372 family protein [Streptococcus suis]MCB2865995.1 DUF1372 family protein [Streptococcus suis]